MPKIKEDKWLEFKENKFSSPLELMKKTKKIEVWSKCSNIILGVIRWHPQWRHYCFFPTSDIETVHSDRCLMSISQFITELNKEHKNAKVI